jgi:hypothetical protein
LEFTIHPYKNGPIHNSMFDVGRSMFDVHFFIRFSFISLYRQIQGPGGEERHRLLNSKG